ncbi:MAG TPA: 23S rRNA (pseudouridine(1915)-N(3))-methyltransferase RlmH [Stellaceae bacterium]|nr:23S rRNA (pseudouridine(1915)-N(3))-methyltransferase RlmH [Stellaceae bacterium]
MRVTIVAIGKQRDGALKALEQLYAGRMTWPLSVREVAEKRKLPPAEMKEREGALLLDACPKGATLVALDARGKTMGSADFAKRLAQWRDNGVADLAFLIGGADGLNDSIKRRADLLLSFGPMTWPHFLARGMLLEQLYRAQTLLAGHPYHRE